MLNNEQYFIAMRATVKQISSATDCTAGTDQPAWGAPFLINPGSANEWANALYYCKQDCTIPTISCVHIRKVIGSAILTCCHGVKM
jgi:hypothetical protein